MVLGCLFLCQNFGDVSTYQFGLLSGHLLGRGCPLALPYIVYSIILKGNLQELNKLYLVLNSLHLCIKFTIYYKINKIPTVHLYLLIFGEP